MLGDISVRRVKNNVFSEYRDYLPGTFFAPHE